MAIVYLDAAGNIQSACDDNALISTSSVVKCSVPDKEWEKHCQNNDNKIVLMPDPATNGQTAISTFVPNHIPDREYWLDGKEHTLVYPATLPEGASFTKPQEVVAAERIAEIKHLLEQDDLAAIRPLRAIADGKATEEDMAKLDELETAAVALRTELAALTSPEPPVDEGGSQPV